MRRLLALASMTFFLIAGLPAQNSIQGLVSKDARSMGMGGSFKVFSQGYQSFFGNPAGFAERRSITLADVAAWGYTDPSPANIRALADIVQGKENLQTAQDYLGKKLASNDLGAGISFGMGWAGEGLGLGLTLVSEAVASGSGYDTASAVMKNEASAILGFAWPVSLGPFTLTIGADVRGFYRLDSSSDWLFADLATAYLTQSGYNAQLAGLELLGGAGVAVDAGIMLKTGGFSLGMMVRDYGDSFVMGETSISGIVESYYLPFTGDTVYLQKPQYSVGMGFTFNQSKFLTTSIYLESDDPEHYLEGIQQDFSASFKTLHAGVEFNFGKILMLRTGFNKGLLSFGLGLDFALIELDAALFNERVDETRDRTGIAIQAALRL